MRIYNAHIVDRRNIGDMVCAPLLYVDMPGHEKAIRDVRQWDPSWKGPIIVGGGGVIIHQFTPILEAMVSTRRFPLVFWGAGINTPGREDPYPDYLRKFDLVGVRDWGREFPWVPCPSAMNPLFDQERPVTRSMVIYEHKDVPLEIPGLPGNSIPRLSNASPRFEEVLDFLGSADIILTNTYHGMYWSILLGRRPVVFPFSSRFYFMKYPVPLTTPESWREALGRARAFPGALEECRAANNAFLEKVGSLLG